jgi:hypothetical protein
VKVFTEALSFHPLKTALEKIRARENKSAFEDSFKDTVPKKLILDEHERETRDVSVILAQFTLTIASRVNSKNKVFLSELLIVVNLFRVSMVNKGPIFVLRRSTEEKIDLEDESIASKPISPIMVMSNLFIVDFFPKLLKEINW